ncbi:MAG: hypothetical protein ACPGD5_05445, partial [Salibacteraceae bacterium]
YDLVSLQNEKEKTAFIQFLKARNKRHDTRNIALYKDFLNGNEKRLLNEMNANAYNALKKRLCDQLIDFSASNVLLKELSAENQVIKLIAISRRLFKSEKIETGFTLLKRGEKIAIGIENHSLLNEIYHSMIEYSHKLSNIDVETLLKKLEKSNQQFLAEERLNVLYSSMRHQYNTHSLKMSPLSLHKMYVEGLTSFGVDTELALSFKTLNQLCGLTDLYAAQTKNYGELDLFFEDWIPLIKGSANDNEHSLGYHIELLYGLANIYFRRNDLKRSQFYLEEMKFEMNRFNGKFSAVYMARYTNLLALNYNFSSSWKKAFSLIEECLRHNKISDAERHLLRLNLSMIHFQQENLLEVKAILNSFKKTDAWYLKELGNEWLFNYRAMEVLLHFDLGNDDLAESLILSFKRKYAVYFKQEKGNPIWPFLLLVKSALHNPELMKTQKFEEKVELSIPWKGKHEDFFNLCFYAWLKSKMKGKSTYETTMQLLESHN